MPVKCSWKTGSGRPAAAATAAALRFSYPRSAPNFVKASMRRSRSTFRGSPDTAAQLTHHRAAMSSPVHNPESDRLSGGDQASLTRAYVRREDHLHRLGFDRRKVRGLFAEEIQGGDGDHTGDQRSLGRARHSLGDGIEGPTALENACRRVDREKPAMHRSGPDPDRLDREHPRDGFELGDEFESRFNRDLDFFRPA